MPAVYVGHPDTTGVPNIDCFLTTKCAEPADCPEHYSERAILIDEFPFYYKYATAVAGTFERTDLELTAAATLYTCPQTERVRARLAKAGPDVIDRVHFQRQMNGLEYLNFVQQSDLLVETLGVSGGNSTYEAPSTGTPILAYAGKHMRSQITIDLLTMIGLGDCVASDRENFISVVLEPADDTAARQEIRRRVPQASPGMLECQSAVEAA